MTYTILQRREETNPAEIFISGSVVFKVGERNLKKVSKESARVVVIPFTSVVSL